MALLIVAGLILGGIVLFFSRWGDPWRKLTPILDRWPEPHSFRLIATENAGGPCSPLPFDSCDTPRVTRLYAAAGQATEVCEQLQQSFRAWPGIRRFAVQSDQSLRTSEQVCDDLHGEVEGRSVTGFVQAASQEHTTQRDELVVFITVFGSSNFEL